MTSSPTRTGHVGIPSSRTHDLSTPNYIACNAHTDRTQNTFPGTNVTYSLWSISEAAISTICICLPNTLYLIRRARHHGIGALFSSREYNLSASVSRSKTTTVCPLGGASSSTGGFLCLYGITSLAVDGDCDDGTSLGTKGRCGVSASGQDRQRSADGEAMMELGQVRLRQDI